MSFGFAQGPPKPHGGPADHEVNNLPTSAWTSLSKAKISKVYSLLNKSYYFNLFHYAYRLIVRLVEEGVRIARKD